MYLGHFSQAQAKVRSKVAINISLLVSFLRLILLAGRLAQAIAIPSGFGRSRIRRNCGYTLLSHVLIPLKVNPKIPNISNENSITFFDW